MRSFLAQATRASLWGLPAVFRRPYNATKAGFHWKAAGKAAAWRLFRTRSRPPAIWRLPPEPAEGAFAAVVVVLRRARRLSCESRVICRWKRGLRRLAASRRALARLAALTRPTGADLGCPSDRRGGMSLRLFDVAPRLFAAQHGIENGQQPSLAPRSSGRARRPTPWRRIARVVRQLPTLLARGAADAAFAKETNHSAQFRAPKHSTNPLLQARPFHKQGSDEPDPFEPAISPSPESPIRECRPHRNNNCSTRRLQPVFWRSRA